MVVFVLDMVAYGLLGSIVGWVWAAVICLGIYALWAWLANRSGR